MLLEPASQSGAQDVKHRFCCHAHQRAVQDLCQLGTGLRELGSQGEGERERGEGERGKQNGSTMKF